MANKMTDQYLANNQQYASGQAVHKPGYPGRQPINPAKHVAVVACMDARLDVEDLARPRPGGRRQQRALRAVQLVVLAWRPSS